MNKLFPLLAFSILLLVPQQYADAATFTFTKVVETGDMIGGLTIGSLPGSGELNNNGEIVFSGGTFPSSFGVMTQNTVFSQTGDLVPGGGGSTFNLFVNDPSINHNGDVAFIARDSANIRGIYTNLGGSLVSVVDTNTIVPGNSPNTFANLHDLSIGGNQIAFHANSAGFHTGIYLVKGGVLTAVANINDAIPGGVSNFGSFGNSPSTDGTAVAFSGGDGTVGSTIDEGVYHNIGGTLNVVADQSTDVPGPIVGTFGDFENPEISNGNVVFVAWDRDCIFGCFGREGVFLHNGVTLSSVADIFTSIPGGSFSFTGFGDTPTVNCHGDVAFTGNGLNNQNGIYTNFGGSLSLVMKRGDMLDGQVVSGVTAPSINDFGDISFFARLPGTNVGALVIASPDSPADPLACQPTGGENGEESTGIGGELIPIEQTSLILAGAQSFSFMIPLVISSIGIGIFVVSRKSENS